MRFLSQALIVLHTIMELDASSIKPSTLYVNPDPCTVVQNELKLITQSVCDGDKYCTNLYWVGHRGNFGLDVPFASTGRKQVLCRESLTWLLPHLKARKASLVNNGPSGGNSVKSQANPPTDSKESSDVLPPTKSQEGPTITSSVSEKSATSQEKVDTDRAIEASKNEPGVVQLSDTTSENAPVKKKKVRKNGKKDKSKEKLPEETEESKVDIKSDSTEIARPDELSISDISAEKQRIKLLRDTWSTRERPAKIPMNRSPPSDQKTQLSRLPEEELAEYFLAQHKAASSGYDIDQIPGRRGFVNLDKLGWVNALFQALGHIESFRSVVHDQLLPLVKSRGLGDSPIDYFLRIVDKAMMSVEKFVSINPINFINELMRSDKIDQRLMQNLPSGLFTSIALWIERIDPAIVERLFGIKIFSDDHCGECDHSRQSVLRTPSFHASLTLRCPDDETIFVNKFEECFQHSTSVGVNSMKCENCGKKGNTGKYALGVMGDDSVVPGPQILFIHVAPKKHATLLEYPTTFDLETMPGANRLSGVYKLRSVIHHAGRHYTTQFHDPIFDTWVSADDQSVQDDVTFTNMSSTVHALVYEKMID